MKRISIGVVDDHQLFREGIVNLISDWGDGYRVTLEAANGRDLLQKLETHPHPELLILDANMPVMDGFETTDRVKKAYPKLKILALTMLDDELSFERLVRSGADGFLNKDTGPSVLRRAVDSIMEKGLFFNPEDMGRMLSILRRNEDETIGINSLNDREKTFIRLACSELTYKAIADEMNLSEKTIDGYRAKVFEKLDVKSRVGLTILAIKEGLVKV
jgi:DNA-binding NarL/FixJ family response regulator